MLFSQTEVKNGYTKFYHENGKVSSEGTMRDGKPDGFWKNYHLNGNLKIEGNRKDYLLDSIWVFYDDKGRASRKVNYVEGKKNGLTWHFDTLGRITQTEEFKNDLKNGYTRRFFPSGKHKQIINYLNGKADGTAYEFTEDSTIVSIVTYKGGITLNREKINQTDELGRKQGLWKELYENGDVKWEANFLNDSLNGFTMEYDKKGNLTSIKKFDNGKQLLRAPEVRQVEVYKERFDDGTLKYEGVYDEGVPIGTHFLYKKKWMCDSMIYYNDSIGGYYSKLVCRNYAVPDSAIEYFNGQIIEKGAVDSARNKTGLWYEYHPTGEFKAKGVYIADNKTGEWEFFYSSGALEQKGKYDKRGRTQGPWKWYYESGKVMREENYVNGKRNGTMVDYDEKGNIITKGNYMDNVKEGYWTYENNEYYEYGNFVNDEPDSLWRSFYKPEKTKLFVGSFSNGIPEGNHVKYYRNGKKMVEGAYVGGLRQGDWKFYDEMGFMYLTITFKDDIEVKWQGDKIYPTYEQSLRTYNIKLSEDKTQTIRKKP